MNTLDIYSEYKITQSLQMHMLRVASLAKIILGSMVNIDHDPIIKACLFHDIANIIKFDLNYDPSLLEPEGHDYWLNVQNDFKLRYGSNEHEATKKILNELQFGEGIIGLVDSIGFAKAPISLENNDMKAMICTYCDQRITPVGLTTLENRIKEGRIRHLKNKSKKYTEDEIVEKCSNALKEIETKIQTMSNINLQTITSKMLEKNLDYLGNLEHS